MGTPFFGQMCSTLDVRRVIMEATMWQSHRLMRLEILYIKLRGRSWRYEQLVLFEAASNTSITVTVLLTTLCFN